MKSLKKATRGPVDVVEGKSGRIPIYGGLHHGRQSYLIVYYADGKRIRHRYSSLAAAKKNARETLGGLTSGIEHVTQLTPAQAAVVDEAVLIARRCNVSLVAAMRAYEEASKVLAGEGSVVDAARLFVAEKNKVKLPPITVSDLADKFMEHLRGQEKSRRYTLDMQARLARVAKAFSGRVADILPQDIDAWLLSMKGTSARTKKNYRRAVVTLFVWAREKGYLSAQDRTAAERSTRYSGRGGDIGIYQPTQLFTLLSQIETRFVPHLAFGAFAGLRSAEIVRLEWSDVRWDQGFIEISKAKAKTASRRLVPILPALELWLADWRKLKSGRVLDGVADEFALATYFKRAVDDVADKDGVPLVKIVPNGLRHSFISYRLAIVKSAAQVALEAGNSPKMIFEHYRELVTPLQADEWFATVPKPEEIAA